MLLEFPSQRAWESFYYSAEYEAIKGIRDEVSSGRMIGVEGLRPGLTAPRGGQHPTLIRDRALPAEPRVVDLVTLEQARDRPAEGGVDGRIGAGESEADHAEKPG